MILLAGGTGRLGSVLAARLTGRGLAVRVLTRDPARAAHLAAHGAEVATGDVRDCASLAPAVRGADVVVSAIQGLTGPRGVTPATIDYQGNINLIDAARAAGAQLVLMSVAGAAADSPMELFRMKHAAEEHLRESGADWTIVRATAFLELWIDVLTSTAARSGRPVVFGRGNNPINFVSVIAVARVVEHDLADPAPHGMPPVKARHPHDEPACLIRTPPIPGTARTDTCTSPTRTSWSLPPMRRCGGTSTSPDLACFRIHDKAARQSPPNHSRVS